MDLTSPNFICSADGEQSRSTTEGKQHIRILHCQSCTRCLQAGVSTGEVPHITGKHCMAKHGEGPVVLQAQLNSLSNQRTLGAATLPLLILPSTETRAKDALPSHLPQSQPQLPSEEQTLLGTLQPPSEYPSGDTGRRTTGEGMDATSLSAVLRAC